MNVLWVNTRMLLFFRLCSLAILISTILAINCAERPRPLPAVRSCASRKNRPPCSAPTILSVAAKMDDGTTSVGRAALHLLNEGPHRERLGTASPLPVLSSRTKLKLEAVRSTISTMTQSQSHIRDRTRSPRARPRTFARQVRATRARTTHTQMYSRTQGSSFGESIPHVAHWPTVT